MHIKLESLRQQGAKHNQQPLACRAIPRLPLNIEASRPHPRRSAQYLIILHRITRLHHIRDTRIPHRQPPLRRHRADRHHPPYARRVSGCRLHRSRVKPRPRLPRKYPGENRNCPKRSHHRASFNKKSGITTCRVKWSTARYTCTITCAPFNFCSSAASASGSPILGPNSKGRP